MCYGQQLGSVESIAGKPLSFLTYLYLFPLLHRELENPHQVLMRLVQPSIFHLPSDIIAVYLQSSLKIFSHWACTLVDRWNDDQLPRVKATAMAVLDGIRPFASHADIEVQERVRWYHFGGSSLTFHAGGKCYPVVHLGKRRS